jgi:hypothetical protein
MKKIKHLVWGLLYAMSKIAYKNKWALITALVMRFTLVPLPDVRHNSAAKKKIIVLNKIGGTDDIIAAYRDSDSAVAFYLLRRNLINSIFNHFLKGKVQHYNYLSDDPEIEANKKAYQNYIRKVLFYLNKIWPYSAIISFNVAYASERELATAMTELKIPFIVCHKECVKTEIKHFIYTKAYRERLGPYSGYHICVYNDEEKESMLRADFASPNQISVVGAPRVDFSHELRMQANNHDVNNTILFYTIFDQAGLPYQDKKWAFGEDNDVYGNSPFDWHELVQKTNDALLEFAWENPDVQVIFKAKQGNEKKSEPLLVGNLPNNVNFIAGGIGHKLLKKAKVVVAFNSASLIESIAAGKNVVVPMFGMENVPNANKYIYQLGDAVTQAPTPEQFKLALHLLIEKPLPSKKLTEEARQVLDRYVGNSDGMAGKRMREVISEVINVSR